MSPGEEVLLIAANAAFADPAFCETVKQMHADGYPLVQMVEALGLDDDMSDRIREILESLTAEAVAGIRKATLEMLSTGNRELPVICTVPQDQLVQPVAVEVSPENGVETIHVRSASK